MSYEDNLMFKIAWYYYFDDLTQQQISDKLGITRMNVIKLLAKAKSQGIVHFKIRTDGEHRLSIERELVRKYGLEDVFVIPTAGVNQNESIALAAAQYVEARLTPDCYINVGYGDTITRVIRNLLNTLDSPVSLVSLTGGVSYYTSSIISGAHKSDFNGITPSIYLIPAPVIASTPELARDFMSDESVKSIMSMNDRASMSIIGIGAATDDATIFKDNKISPNERVLLQMSGAVGDLLSQFIDKNGQVIQSDLHDRLVATKLDVLKKYHNVIGVAAGESKVNAMHAALLGGYLNTLITDEDTATRLLAIN